MWEAPDRGGFRDWTEKEKRKKRAEVISILNIYTIRIDSPHHQRKKKKRIRKKRKDTKGRNLVDNVIFISIEKKKKRTIRKGHTGGR